MSGIRWSLQHGLISNHQQSTARKRSPKSLRWKRKLLQFESLEDRRLLATVNGSLTPSPIYEGGPVFSPPGPNSSYSVISANLIGSFLYANASVVITGEVDAYTVRDGSSNLITPTSTTEPDSRTYNFGLFSSLFFIVHATEDETIAHTPDTLDNANDNLSIEIRFDYYENMTDPKTATKTLPLLIIDNDTPPPTINEDLVLMASDTTATEPHSTFYQPVSPLDTGTFRIDVPSHWGGGTVQLNLAGSATYGVDYTLGLAAVGGTATWGGSGPQAGPLSLNIPMGVTQVLVNVIPLADATETDPGENVILSVSPANQTFTGVPSNYIITAAGSGTVTIADVLEGLNLSASPSTTPEYRTDGNYAAFVIKPDLTTATMQGSAYLRIDASQKGDATPGVDYSLTLGGQPLILTQGPPNIWTSAAIALSGTERRVVVVPINDKILEGEEKIRADLRTLPVNSLPDMSHGGSQVTITENYLDAKIQKDEKASGCDCSCNCSDGNAIRTDQQSGSVSVSTAGGIVAVASQDQNGSNPVVYVGLQLPGGKVVPSVIEVLVQAVEKDADINGNPQGLGRKLVSGSPNLSPTQSLQVPSNANPGDFLWFAIQTDLSSLVQSWGRSGGQNPIGSSGVTEQIVSMEILANSIFPAVKPGGGPVTTDDKFSGWVGHTTHALRDQTANGSLYPGMGINASVSGVDRLVRYQTILTPDVPISGGSSGGKVKFEQGSMLFRADGTQSWFKDNTQSPPNTQDVLGGNVVTDRGGNRRSFDLLGNMISFSDASGNVTNYAYAADGGISSVTNSLGQVTTFVRGTSGTDKTLSISTANNGVNLRKYSLIGTPLSVNGGVLRVRYEDPDGPTGPRAQREDVFNYNSAGFLVSMMTGTLGSPEHTTTFTYDVTYQTQNGWLTPSAGSRRLSKITYPDQSSLTIDLSRHQNSLISSLYSGGTILSNDPRAFIIEPLLADNPLSDYAVTTYRRTGTSDPQRTIYQIDHAGRVYRMWDPAQVAEMGLESTTTWNAAAFVTLQANVSRSYESLREPTQRHALRSNYRNGLWRDHHSQNPYPECWRRSTDYYLQLHEQQPRYRATAAAKSAILHMERSVRHTHAGHR